MKIISHIESDADLTFLEGKDCFEDWFDNRSEPVVRSGGEEFQVHFEPEIGWEIFTIDPRRSFVQPLWRAMFSIGYDYDSFPVADFIAHFVQDVGLDINAPKASMCTAFYTMFPRIAAKILANSWMHIGVFSQRCSEMARVVNNPFFYADANASSRRLLEIAQDDGFSYAVDMTNEIPSAETLAHEIALVNHIQEGETVVATAEREILRQVSEVL